MTTVPIPLKDIQTVMKDINSFREDPKTMIERFNVVLYSLKGFKKNEQTVQFIEEFIEELNIMDALPPITLDPFLSMVAQKIQDAADKKNISPDKFEDDELVNITKPFMRNFGERIHVVCENHSSAAKFLVKAILKEDPKRGQGFENPFLYTFTDAQLTKMGGAGKMIGKTGHYLLIFVEKYEKFEKRGDLTDEEFKEFKRVFKLFDSDDNGTLTPEEFSEIVDKPGVRAQWPLINVFQKLLFSGGHEFGASLDEFIDACLDFGGLSSTNNEDIIRRIFNLYRDDSDNDTLSLTGLKRIVNDLEVEPQMGEINLLHRFTYDKNIKTDYNEFRDFIKKGIKNGSIKMPIKL